MKYLLIAIGCLVIALIASTGFTYDVMFFHVDRTTLERNEPIIVMTEYDHCLRWTNEEEPSCANWQTPRPLRLKSSTPHIVYRDVYVVNSVEAESYFFCLAETYDGEDDQGNHIDLIEPQCIKQEVRYRDIIVPVELRNVVRVGQYAGKDIIHAVSDNEALKAAPSYLGDSYESLIGVPDHGQGISDAVLEVIQEVDEEDPETGQMRKVRKRLKTQEWKDKGRPEVKISGGNVPHKWAGIN